MGKKIENKYKEEGITRCLIYQEFIETNFYRDNLQSILNIIETQNAKIKTSRQFAGEKNMYYFIISETIFNLSNGVI